MADRIVEHIQVGQRYKVLWALHVIVLLRGVFKSIDPLSKLVIT